MKARTAALAGIAIVAVVLLVASSQWLSASAGGPPGDADCDGSANSIDAALVLQFDTGLITSLACQIAADANGDKTVDSIDAALILQFEAGLIHALGPVMELTATLSEIAGSGVTGNATLVAVTGGILVTVTMEGLPEGPHFNNIHIGNCDAQSDIEVLLEELQADAEGVAFNSTTVDPGFPLSHFRVGHFVAVHDTVGAMISCGDIVEG